ncbi:YqaE/Pmp3 family membrane protein [Halomonas aquamarina]|uniref:YqaE/Pmp3 family membrane protein n=1 Tax=Vreelandella aquamarina TaxID=77097 RepID=A0ACC5VYV5_9GAMM|nr:YqaE/Pmp3 family membrane protein [Halomonas aquamarina]MBZ5488929.1 YqaE/Pmp3 family membrane protein [Halomonas aquamarina]
MDAREYLNRKGIGVEREPERPNTLEEKAWERARGAGMQRPRSGTPHDWEDWERHHDDIAQDAESLEQKIDKQAHRKGHADTPSGAKAQDAVGHFTPAAVTPPGVADGDVARDTATTPKSASQEVRQPHRVENETGSLKAAYCLLAVLLPPLALGLTDAGSRRIGISVILTLLGWLPGVIHALMWLARR